MKNLETFFYEFHNLFRRSMTDFGEAMRTVSSNFLIPPEPHFKPIFVYFFTSSNAIYPIHMSIKIAFDNKDIETPSAFMTYTNHFLSNFFYFYFRYLTLNPGIPFYCIITRRFHRIDQRDSSGLAHI